MAPETPPHHRRPPNAPADPGRRAFLIGGLRAATALGVAAAAAKLSSDLIPAGKDTGESAAVPSSAELSENELTERLVEAFQYAFSSLTSQEVIFIDQNFLPITGQPIPLADDANGKEILQMDEEIRQLTSQVLNFNPGGRKSRKRQLAALKTKLDTLTANRKAKFQTWLNKKRADLHAAYPNIEYSLEEDRETPELISTRGVLVNEKDTSISHFSLIRKNAVRPVSAANPMSRIKFIEQAFGRSKVLPKSLCALMPALVGVESNYMDDIESDAGAHGPWQFTYETWVDMGKQTGRKSKPDKRKNFEEATLRAVAYFEYLYKNFYQYPAAQAIKAEHGLTDEQFAEDFITPVTVNSYHSGIGNVWQMLDWFAVNYPAAKVRSQIGVPPYGQDIYTFMSAAYMKKGRNKSYGRQSRNYYPRIVALTGLLQNPEEEVKLDNGYEQPEAEGVLLGGSPRGGHAEGQSAVLSLAEIGAAAAAGGVLLNAEAGVSATQSGTRNLLSRRGFIASGLAAGAGMALGLGKGLISRLKGEPKPVVPDETKPCKDSYCPSKMDQQLISENVSVKNLRLLTTAERGILRNRFKNPHLRAWAQKQGLAPMRHDSELAASKTLSPLQEAAGAYRLRGVGNPTGSPKNDTLYAKLRPNAKSILEQIAEEVDREAHAAGLPAKYRARILVTSAARTDDYQRKLRKHNSNAARWSSHTFGNSFDITWKRFDIADAATGQFTMAVMGEPLEKQLKLAQGLETILGRVLIKLMNEGKIMAFQEFGQSVFHVMALN